MSVTNEPTHKLTVKIAGELRTIQGGTYAEFEQARGELLAGLEADVQVINIAHAAGTAAPLVGAPAGVADVNPWPAQPVGPAIVAPAYAAPPPPPAGGGHNCAHGAMTRRTGTSAKGPWTGFFCPLPKGDPNQCKAVFV